MTIELDKAALFAAWQAFYSMDSADPSGMEAAIRAYLAAIRQPHRDAVVEAARKWDHYRFIADEIWGMRSSASQAARESAVDDLRDAKADLLRALSELEAAHD